MRLEERKIPMPTGIVDAPHVPGSRPAVVEEHLQGEAQPLDEARMVVEQRGRVYGTSRENMTRIAALWRAQFGWDVDPTDVPLAMLLVKTARLAVTPDHRDSVVDLHGYADVYWRTL